jgi:general secretion pathway protein A
MDDRKLSALYGLKWNPFLQDIPVEALCKTPRIDHFGWRVEDLVMHGGFALVTGDPGAGKSAVLRMLADRLGGLRDVVVGEVTRPQSRVTDFYRELGDLFGLAVSGSNRWGAYKTVRASWQAHIQQTLFRPVLLVDEAQEMSPLLLAELRLLGSTKLDSCTIVTVILCGDRGSTKSCAPQTSCPSPVGSASASCSRPRRPTPSVRCCVTSSRPRATPRS